MKQQTDSNKGYTLIGVMVSIVMLGTFSMMMLTTTNFFNNNQVSVRESMIIEQESRNKVLDVYEMDDWSRLSNDTIETDTGDLVVQYTYHQPGEYYTESIDITFTLNGKSEKYTLERSVVGRE